MSEDEKKPTKKPVKYINNTMLLQLINSQGSLISAEGPCTDLEIKAICRALTHTPEQKIEIKP